MECLKCPVIVKTDNSVTFVRGASVACQNRLRQCQISMETRQNSVCLDFRFQNMSSANKTTNIILSRSLCGNPR